MGQSTDAILFFGYTWQGEADEEEISTEEWVNRLLEGRGQEYTYEAEKALEQEFGCDVAWHCSCDYAIPYVYVIGTKTLASRGDAEVVDPNEMIDQDTAEARQKLDTFIAATGIDISEAEGPGWFLVSMWC